MYSGARHGFWTWLCPGSEFLEYLLGHEWGLQGDQFVGYVLCGMLFSRVAKVSSMSPCSRKGFTSFWLEKASKYFLNTFRESRSTVEISMLLPSMLSKRALQCLYIMRHLVFHGLNNPIIDRSSLPKYLRLATLRWRLKPSTSDSFCLVDHWEPSLAAHIQCPCPKKGEGKELPSALWRCHERW